MPLVVWVAIVATGLDSDRFQVRRAIQVKALGELSPFAAGIDLLRRHRSAEVRLQAERCRERLLCRRLASCRPSGYPVWPCIDFLGGHCLSQYPICRGCDFESPLATALVRCYLQHAAYQAPPGYSSAWPQYRLATERWVSDLIRSGHDPAPIRATIAEMARRERAWLRAASMRWPPPIVLASDRISVVGLKWWPSEQ